MTLAVISHMTLKKSSGIRMCRIIESWVLKFRTMKMINKVIRNHTVVSSLSYLMLIVTESPEKLEDAELGY